MDYDEILEMAKLKIDLLPPDTEFVLRDLFQGTFWNDLDKGFRLQLGHRFKDSVTRGTIPHVAYLGKRDNNSALYEKQ